MDIEGGQKLSSFEKTLFHKGIVLCLSGPSGVGKGTVIHALRQLDEKLELSVSMTTRKARLGEREGIEYYFVSKEHFLSKLEQGEILEHDCYCDNYYGTPLAAIEAHREAGRDVILDVTVAGSLAVDKNYENAVTVFLLPPDMDELEHRLLERGTEETELVRKRMSFAREEIKEATKFKYILINKNVLETAEQLWHIIEAERHNINNISGIESCLKNL